MAKPTTSYVIIDVGGELVLPIEAGLEAFRFLVQGEPVVYDWQSKTYRRSADHKPTLKGFTVDQYATLVLNDD